MNNISYRLSTYTFKSFILHVLVVLCFLLVGKFSFDSNPKRKIERIIKSSVKVDLVAMPKLTLKEIKAMNAQITPPTKPVKQEKKAEVKAAKKVESDAKNTFLKKEKKKSFLDSIKKYGDKKIEKAKPVKTVAKDKAPEPKKGLNLATSEFKELLNEGNQIRSGVGNNGSGESIFYSDLDKYLIEVAEKVRMNWSLPSYLMDQELNCRIQVFISKTGKLLKTSIIESSGNSEYDDRAINSIKKSSPFPVPGSNIEGKVIKGESVLGFPL